MIITSDDMQSIQDPKHFFSYQFEMKDLDPLNYFFSLEVSSSAYGYYLTQAKYTSDLIKNNINQMRNLITWPIEIPNRKTDSKNGIRT